MAGPISRHLLPDSAAVGPNGDLYVGGISLLELAAEYGTPLFVYDEDHLRARCREAVAAFGDGATYASKAFLCKAMAKLAYEEGMAIDCASGGEMHVAVAAGVPGDHIILHGNNKSSAELEMALKVGVRHIVVDSFDEFDRLDQAVVKVGYKGVRFAKAPIQIRITPGVKVHTHEYVQTGQDDSKFGFTVSTGLAAEAIKKAQESLTVELRGLHMHIGSQVFDADSFAKAAHVMLDLSNPLGLPEVTFGGGLGVAYVEAESAPSITEWANALKVAIEASGCTSQVAMEPGRSIVASAAVTLYTVGTIKDLEGIRTYCAVDGGMSDNPRPVMYGSGYEAFLPRSPFVERGKPVRLVGKHCESGDLLIDEAWLPRDLKIGDVLCTPVTGAYGYTMANNYNKVPRPAVVFVSQGEARIVARRETLDDLIRLDIG